MRSPRPTSGMRVECFGVGAAVVPGEDLGEGARLVRDGALADLAAGDRQMGDSHGENGGKATCSFDLYDARAAGMILRGAHRMHTSRHVSAFVRQSLPG